MPDQSPCTYAIAGALIISLVLYQAIGAVRQCLDTSRARRKSALEHHAARCERQALIFARLASEAAELGDAYYTMRNTAHYGKWARRARLLEAQARRLKHGN